MNDLEIVMAYTGWSAETAQSAIRTWRKCRPAWNARYLLPFVRRHLTSVPADRLQSPRRSNLDDTAAAEHRGSPSCGGVD